VAKRYLGMNVLDAARQRIAWVFDTFPRIYTSFSGGKDSSVMLHLVMDEAIRRNRKVGMLYVDFEAQYKLSIDHTREMYQLYADHSEPYWVALPIHLRNAVSQYQHHWICWEPGREADWVRQPDPMSITDQKAFPFYRYGMEFEDFVPEFGQWYGGDQLTACFVGIRTAESLNRWRTIAGHGTKFEGRNWCGWVGKNLWNVYPIYDWSTEDDWRYFGKTRKPYPRVYDLMYQAGLSIHQSRLCQPYGDDQRKGLWLFHLLEPQTWARIVARVNGANAGALYAQESGNILGNLKISKPEGHTWESFAGLLLDSLPPKTQEHFKNKIATFLWWWKQHGYDSIPDEADAKLEAAREVPSWRRICKALLRNDYWCKGLSFSQHTSGAYERYKKIMEKRRRTWGIYSDIASPNVSRR
jgi:predicted phosphoadenosine phosphosulfate sulfurtransferase